MSVTRFFSTTPISFPGTYVMSRAPRCSVAHADRRALELQPRQPTYRLNLASVLARSKRTEEAVEQIAHALAIAPGLEKILPGFQEFADLLQHPRIRRPQL